MNLTTLYRYEEWEWGRIKKAIEFRTVLWCTTHDSRIDYDFDDEFFVCLQARAWRHHAPKNTCKFVDKLIEK